MSKCSVALLATALWLPTGCSRRDPPTITPVYHAGTPTNRSSTNSWEIGQEPFYTQPGVNSGRPVLLKPIPSQAGLEPDDPLALAVYRAIVADGAIPTRYLEVSARRGLVVIVGTVPSAAQKQRAEAIARTTPGVRTVRSQITVAGAPPGAGTM